MEKTRVNFTIPAWLDSRVREYAIANGVSFTRVVTEAICRFFDVDSKLVYFRRRIAPVRVHPEYGDLPDPNVITKTAEDAEREHGVGWLSDMARRLMAGNFSEDQIPAKWRPLILAEADRIATENVDAEFRKVASIVEADEPTPARQAASDEPAK